MTTILILVCKKQTPLKNTDRGPEKVGGLEAIRDFYRKYTTLNKSVSPLNYKARSAAYEYLKEVEMLRQLPKVMGIAKWRGPPSELNLWFFVFIF